MTATTTSFASPLFCLTVIPPLIVPPFPFFNIAGSESVSKRRRWRNTKSSFRSTPPTLSYSWTKIIVIRIGIGTTLNSLLLLCLGSITTTYGHLLLLVLLLMIILRLRMLDLNLMMVRGTGRRERRSSRTLPLLNKRT
ncbi:uncharacterized protein EI90DRAFT_3042443 [Cantharellus anzutake]|uniref:uncharacterized protein n=1 Tax=Cantharellus anzutake TaxID=1750568 RepID=UPI001906A50B|nr:uncharacterized protein EI90DRAFT_3042443 [Cantharellus anzutake]KAF8338306.1 hypothetical protein EI90DRAFT_3042443 [Cantharellus anzutake]